MIIIECEGEYSWGGRTSDIYVLEDFNDLDELQEYIKNNQPVKAKQPTSYYKRYIIEQESLRDRIVYLNNYLKIKKVNLYIMLSEAIDELDNTVCKGCKFNDGSLSASLSCRYEEENGTCLNREETFSLVQWIKNKIN